MNQIRFNRVLEKMNEMKLDYMIISDPSSIDYLCNIQNHPGERMYALLIDAKNNQHRLFLNKLFFIPQDVGVEKIWFSDTDDSIGLMANVIKPHSTIGIDKNWPAHFLLDLQVHLTDCTFKNGSKCIDEVRMIKDEFEIELMKKASLINDEAIARLASTIQEGDSEEDVANRLLNIYIELGASNHSFNPIVAFGKNGADPHHENDNTLLTKGDSIIIDMGCVYEGYCSDMTRTFFFNDVNDRQKLIYETVLKANLEAQKMIKPGVKLCDIDATARKVISDAGFGEYFTHRLGHFIGKDVHEYGDVSSQFDKPVEAGMIFSIEPGIYLPDEFGVRIEDLVLVSDNGCISLNHHSKNLKVL